ncbi:hypothetical protein Tco_0487928 [Tanacetum coccineum]
MYQDCERNYIGGQTMKADIAHYVANVTCAQGQGEHQGIGYCYVQSRNTRVDSGIISRWILFTKLPRENDPLGQLATSFQKALGTDISMSMRIIRRKKLTAEQEEPFKLSRPCLQCMRDRFCAMAGSAFATRRWESNLTSPELIQDTTDKDGPDSKQRMQAVQDRQKSYADRKRKPMEFDIGDRVMLKQSWGKLSYRLELPKRGARVSPYFHVSNLKKCYADKPLVMPLEGIHVDDKLPFMEEPVEIMEQEIKRLSKAGYIG